MEEDWITMYKARFVPEEKIDRDTSVNESTGTKWITFIGHGRSGHTIISAILDSHPNVRISEEQKYIKRWYMEGWTKDQILKHLLPSGQGKERKLKALPGSGAWTGENELLAVGDKWGYDAVGLVRTQDASLELLDQFSSHMGMEVKVIHTIRNPYDNICAWLDSPKYKRMWGDNEDYSYRMSVRQYVRFYSVASQLIERYDHFNLYNDEIIARPREIITNLCEYLELPIVEPWLTNAANSLYKKPNVRSDNREWPEKWVENIDQRVISKYAYFNRFRR